MAISRRAAIGAIAAAALLGSSALAADVPVGNKGRKLPNGPFFPAVPAKLQVAADSFAPLACSFVRSDVACPPCLLSHHESPLFCAQGSTSARTACGQSTRMKSSLGGMPFLTCVLVPQRWRPPFAFADDGTRPRPVSTPLVALADPMLARPAVPPLVVGDHGPLQRVRPPPLGLPPSACSLPLLAPANPRRFCCPPVRPQPPQRRGLSHLGPVPQGAGACARGPGGRQSRQPAHEALSLPAFSPLGPPPLSPQDDPSLHTFKELMETYLRGKTIFWTGDSIMNLVANAAVRGGTGRTTTAASRSPRAATRRPARTRRPPAAPRARAGVRVRAGVPEDRPPLPLLRAALGRL